MQQLRENVQMERVVEFAQANGVRHRAEVLLQDMRPKIQAQAPSHETPKINSQLRRSVAIGRRIDQGTR